jgi:transcriptional regulator with XRE-family HTH domain
VRRYDPDKLVRDVGRRVAEVRHERGLTQHALATKLRATMQWVQQIEYGTNLTLFSLARLANVLEVSLETFLLAPRAGSYVLRPGRPRKEPLPVVAEATEVEGGGRTVPQPRRSPRRRVKR